MEMKKSEIIISITSIIFLLCMSWVAGAWYTGKLIEKNMDRLVSSANEKINKYMPNEIITVDYQDYQRGIFSSSLRYIVKVGSERMIFSQTIYHGPFPLDQLTIFPSLASLSTTMEKTDTVKNLFSLTDGKGLLHIKTRITYKGYDENEINAIPFSWKGNQETILSIDGYPLYAVLALLNTQWHTPFYYASLKIARPKLKNILYQYKMKMMGSNGIYDHRDQDPVSAMIG